MGETLTYWVVGFIVRPRAHWWDWLYRGPFRHVVAFRFDPLTKHWQMMDWSTSGFTVVSQARVDAADAWVEIKLEGGKLVEWVSSKPTPARLCWPAYCVPAIASMVGSPVAAWTPRGLMGALLRSGGRSFLADITTATGGHHGQHLQSLDTET